MTETTVESRQAFNKLIIDQFAYGGQKYKSDSVQKEATDILFDTHGYRWLIGTIDKYTFRFKNLQRERDLLKVGTYMYLIWLKRGYHLSAKGIIPAINTNVETKTKNFDKFIAFLESYITDNEYLTNMEVSAMIEILHEQLCVWSLADWESITDECLYDMYNLTFNIWNKLYAEKAGQDTDTWNEEAKRKD
jgi:hypothetical protein